MSRPGYLDLYASGELSERADRLERILHCCTLCPRQCGVDRRSGQLGACGVDGRPKVAAMSIHPWEEPPISGSRGSGTIFFSGCTLQCVFCQNYPISQLGGGGCMEVEQLAAGMLRLQRQGTHNLNLVAPTHQLPAIVHALVLAVPGGLNLPLVYNSSGYERPETLRMLEGIVDIYLPDIKYADPEHARLCSKRSDYVRYNRAALLEMWRQVGPLSLDAEGIARRGLLVRHLVLPNGLADSGECLSFLARNFGPAVWVSLMNQYFPAHQAPQMELLQRKITDEEYAAVFQWLIELGLENGFVQGESTEECWQVVAEESF